MHQCMKLYEILLPLSGARSNVKLFPCVKLPCMGRISFNTNVREMTALEYYPQLICNTVRNMFSLICYNQNVGTSFYSVTACAEPELQLLLRVHLKKLVSYDLL